MIDQKNKAFTIVELLVVVTIIGILASAVTVSIIGYQRKARDSRRGADLSTIEKTLASYYSDNFVYPPYTSGCESSVGTGINNAPLPVCPPLIISTGWDQTSNFYQNLVPKYISTLPVDPINDATYYYRYRTSAAPLGQCFFWVYITESGGTNTIGTSVGDTRDVNGIIDPTGCEFL